MMPCVKHVTGQMEHEKEEEEEKKRKLLEHTLINSLDQINGAAECHRQPLH